MKMYKILPFVCLLILAVIVSKMYQTIPEGQAVAERRSVIDQHVSQPVKPIEGRNFFNAEQISFAFGIGVIIGGILTYLINNRVLKIMYQRSFEKFGEELRRQYRLKRLSGRDEEVDYE